MRLIMDNRSRSPSNNRAGSAALLEAARPLKRIKKGRGSYAPGATNAGNGENKAGGP
jgi:hypothetical protein